MARRTRILALLPALLLAPSPSAAEDNAFVEYLRGAGTQLALGLHSLAFAPLDPFAETIWPPEDFAEVPAAPLTSRVLGAGTGLLLGGYRVLMGTTDLLLTPIPMVPVSPQLRFTLVPGLEQEREDDPEWICDLDGWGEEARSWAHRAGTLVCFPWSRGTPQEESGE